MLKREVFSGVDKKKLEVTINGGFCIDYNLLDTLKVKKGRFLVVLENPFLFAKQNDTLDEALLDVMPLEDAVVQVEDITYICKHTTDTEMLQRKSYVKCKIDKNRNNAQQILKNRFDKYRQKMVKGVQNAYTKSRH